MVLVANHTHFTPEQIERMAKLRERGHTLQFIGARFGCTGSCVHKLLKARDARREADGKG